MLSTLRGTSQDNELIELEFLEIKAQSMFEKRSVAERFPHLVELTAWNTINLYVMYEDTSFCHTDDTLQAIRFDRVSFHDQTHVPTCCNCYSHHVLSAMDGN